jgi:hypothetical protein
MDEDSEKNDKYNEMLGYTYIFLNEKISFNSSRKVKPKWEQLYLDKSNLPRGQILISFYIFDSAHLEEIQNVNIEPETIEYNFTINALGLRDLKPLTFIEIKKPFISFDLNSIDVTKRIAPLDEIKTLPNESGPNPNVNSIISFSAQLPKELDFVPQLQCNVYDHVLGGMMTKLLGVFLLDLKQIIKETERVYKYEKDKAKEIEETFKEKKDENILTKSELSESNRLLIEKDIESHNKPLINEDDINTKNNLKKPLVDDSKLNDLGVLIDNKDNSSEDYICHKPSDLNKIYRGPIDNIKLNSDEIIHNSEYFVLKPSFTTMNLPKTRFKVDEKKKSKNDNNDNKI